VVRLIREEVIDPFAQQRLETRVTAAMRYAMRATCDSRRSGGELRRAMQYLDQVKSNPFDSPDPTDFAAFLREQVASLKAARATASSPPTASQD
jgi:hypothetical protein